MCKHPATAEGSEREKLKEAIHRARGAIDAGYWSPSIEVLRTLAEAAEARLAALPKPPRKEPRVVYAVYTEDGTFHGAYQDREVARRTNLYLYGSRLVVLTGKIELP